jgi:hypothetical protein
VNDVDPTLVYLDRAPIAENIREVIAEKENIDKEEEKKEEKKEGEKEKEKEVPIPEAAPAPTKAQPNTATANKPAKEAKTRKCKETEELYEDRCLKKCTEDEFRNPVTKRCNKTKKNK